MTGDKIIMRLKADPSTKKIPVILITGYTDAKVTKLALGAGAAKVMIKPFGLDKLLDAIKHCLSCGPDSDPGVVESGDC